MKFNKKKVTAFLPFVLMGYFFNKISQAFTSVDGVELGDKIMNGMDGIKEVFLNPLPSFNPIDLLIGVAGGVIIKLVIYVKGKNAKKYRKGCEYGSARWGTAEDMKPYMAEKFEDNIILTETERLTMEGRPKAGPKYARNKNILVIGGSGSGKTRFFVKPNLLQMHSSYVVTDPKGTVLLEVGKALKEGGYAIKVLNTINFKKSMHYNPLAYIRSEKDIVTYPRTDSQYITDDMNENARNIAELVGKKFAHFDGLVLAPDTKRVINNKKVSDHHGIIPTAELDSTDISSVPDGEKKILYLIANRLLCATSEPYIYETVTAEISCGGYSFVARGRNVISEGFKAIEKAFRSYQKCKDDTEETEEESVALSEGQVIERPISEVTEHFTQPPKHYTEDTLLSAMERAGTDELTEEVERSGLGTPATRASIIEKLTKSGFIKREKKNLVVTENGTDLISVMPDIIKSASMTADWENSLYGC